MWDNGFTAHISRTYDGRGVGRNPPKKFLEFCGKIICRHWKVSVFTVNTTVKREDDWVLAEIPLIKRQWDRVLILGVVIVALCTTCTTRALEIIYKQFAIEFSCNLCSEI